MEGPGADARVRRIHMVESCGARLFLIIKHSARNATKIITGAWSGALSMCVCVFSCVLVRACLCVFTFNKSVSICIYGLVRQCHVCACMTVRSIASDWTGRSEREGETEKVDKNYLTD